MTLENLLKKPENEISLMEAAIQIAKESVPDLTRDFDKSKYISQLEGMADELKKRIDGIKRPEEIIFEINKYLFEELGFYSKNGYPFLINKVLEEKKGNCAGLSTLYLILSEKLNLPIYGVALPNHIFIRWQDNEYKINIETANKGKEVSDSTYIPHFEIPEKCLKEGIYLRNLSKKEVIADLLNNKGNALRKLVQPDKVITWYDRALEINLKFVEAWNNKGFALEELGKLEEAIICYDKALEINPKYAEAWNNKGNALRKLGKLDKAIICCDKALEINPKFAEAWNNKGVTLRELGKPDEAITGYDRALEINPEYVVAWYNKGAALRELGKLEEAITCYDKALEINPKFDRAWYNKGVTLRELGRLDKAKYAFGRFIELAPPDLEDYIKQAKEIVSKIV